MKSYLGDYVCKKKRKNSKKNGWAGDTITLWIGPNISEDGLYRYIKDA